MDPLGLLPETLFGGESIVASVVVSGYLPATHDLAYQFTGPTAAAFSVAAVANEGGTGWNLTVPAASTATWPTCRVLFVGLATAKTGGVVTAVDTGAIAITASPLYVSWARTALAAVEAAISGRATDAQKRVALGDMSVEGMTLDELLKARAWLQTEALAEGANRTIRIMRTRFI